jgi:hypothetical protein
VQRLDQLFEQFLRERTYVTNVTASTLEWYETAWKAFKVAHGNRPERATSAALISKADLQHFVIHLRERRGASTCASPNGLRRIHDIARLLV